MTGFYFDSKYHTICICYGVQILKLQLVNCDMALQMYKGLPQCMYTLNSHVYSWGVGGELAHC